jgi:hypothetical protein
MKHLIKKVEAVITAINLIRLKNGHLFSVEDHNLLDQCLQNLKLLKVEMAENKLSRTTVFGKLENVIRLVDVFFGLGDIVKQYFNS